MNCPVCKVPLIAVERDQVEVDYCISCRGLWFDRGELELLAERLAITLDIKSLAGAATVTAERPRSCPRCGKTMLKNELASTRRVITDQCPAGEGMWFDARELGSVLDHIAEMHGATRPVANFLGEMFGRRS